MPRPILFAKDPVNMVGYAASNIVDGFVDTVQWHEIDRIVKNGGYLIDVREPNELKQGMIKDSINIPLDELRVDWMKCQWTKKYISLANLV